MGVPSRLPRVSLYNALLILCLISDSTNWLTSKLPGNCNASSPRLPGLLGITVPGISLILAGFNTPSSSPCHTPDNASSAFSRISCTVRLAVLIAANELYTGPLPYTSSAVLDQRNTTQGLAPSPSKVSS